MTKTTIDLTNLLKAEHMRQFPHLLDDDLPDAFNDWIATMDGVTMLETVEAVIERAFNN